MARHYKFKSKIHYTKQALLDAITISKKLSK